jgi:pimeloyl-ACP methyl ester carboxylesterase
MTPAADEIAPGDLFLDLRGLRHHAVVWGDGPRTVLLLHGWLDHARLFDKLAARLASPSLRLVAVDFRGHGDSEHAPRSGSYQYPEYVADVHAWVEALSPGRPVALVAHSMGGMAAQYFAGAFPERVSHLCAIESMGPPSMSPEMAVTRLRGFVEDMARLGTRDPRHYPTLEEAARQVVAKHPRIHPDDALHYARHGMHGVVVDGEPAWRWKFDPRLHSRGPMAFFEDQALAFLDRITAPVTVVEGSDGYLLDDATFARRFARFRRARRVLVPGAAHHVHLDAPDAVADAVRELLALPG